MRFYEQWFRFTTFLMAYETIEHSLEELANNSLIFVIRALVV